MFKAKQQELSARPPFADRIRAAFQSLNGDQVRALRALQDKKRNMNELATKAHILVKKQERERMQDLWEEIEHLDETVGLETDTFKELQAKISGKINQCDRSIRDHEILLPK